MKKLYIFMLMLLLFGQTILGPMATVKAQEVSLPSIFSINEGVLIGANENHEIEEEQTITLTYDWSLTDQVTDELQESVQLPEQLQALPNQQGQLVVGEIEIGSYTISETTLTVEIYGLEQQNENVDAGLEPENGAEETETDPENGTDENSTEIESENGTDENGIEPGNEFAISTILETEPVTVTGNGTIVVEVQLAEGAQGKFSFGGQEYSVNAKEEQQGIEANLSEIEKQGFTLKLKDVKDLDGNPYSEGNLLKPTDEFWLSFDWELENNHNYQDGDIETYNLPNGIKIQEDIPIDLNDESTGLTVARAIFKQNNTVELTFTDFVEEHSNVTGWAEIISMLDQDNIEVEDGNVILRPIGDEGAIRIPIDLSDRQKTIEKKGTPNKGYNADEIAWEVTINKLKNSLTNVKVIDELPEGTEYKGGSLTVTKLNVDFKGNILGDLEEVPLTPDSTEGNLTIPLGDIKDAYRIEYVTTVIDDEQKEFKNNVILSDADLADVSAAATVTIKRGEPIKKSAVTSYNPKTGIVEWKIDFNFNQKNLDNVTLTDVWTPVGKMELVEDSLQFQEATIDENGEAHKVGDAINLPAGATFVNGVDQFEVTGISTDKAYIVTYQTKVKERVLDGFEVSNTAGFATWSDGAGKYVGEYYGSKSAGNIDYQKKTIDWKIELNHDEYPMEKMSIVDTLGAGLTLDKESIEITVDGSSYEGLTVSGVNPFELKFPDDFKTEKKIVITYKTNYVADMVPSNKATNEAAITWTPVGGSDSITKTVTAETSLNQSTGDNSWKNGSYNPDTKEITWTIFTNYRENQVGNLIVKDEPQGNQTIISNSIVVTELEIASNGAIKESNQLTGVSTIDEDNNSLEVNIGSTDKAYKIEYKTSIAGLSDIQKDYVNEAKVLDDSEVLSEIDAKVGIAKANIYGAKSGKQEDKRINWSVTVNPGQQMVTNLQLEDTISDNQEYIIDTINVYEASVDLNGNATKKGDKPISAARYELIHTEGEPTFTVKWKETVERAFIVEYSTLFFEKHNGVVTNSYKVTGDHFVEDAVTDGDGSVQVKQFGSGGGAGEVGYLVVEKVGRTEGVVTGNLPGVEFELIDVTSGEVIKTGTTDKNGKLDFGRLLYGDYLLKEVKAPEGYVSTEEKITINEPYEAGNDSKKGTVKEVINEKILQSLEFKKTDTHDGQPLDGVEFKLQMEVDGVYTVLDGYESLVTKDGGKIIIDHLAPGKYQLVETKTLDTHWLDEKPRSFVIEKNQTNVTRVSMENYKIGEFTVQKIDAADATIFLKGAVFTLVNQEDNEITYTATTGDDGIARFTGVKYGTYILTETTAPEGYVGISEEIEVTIDSPTKDYGTIKNEKIHQAVKLLKVDESSQESLKGAEFTLHNADDGSIVTDKEGNEIRRTTDDHGEITINNLEPGDYYFLETKAPEHYFLDADEENRETEVFTIKKNQTEFTEVTMDNKRGKGSLIITKTDAANSAKLSGTEFELTNRKGDVVVGKKTTDANGQIAYIDLPYDTYKLKETKAKAGYVIDGKEHTIVVSDDAEDGKVFYKTITNKKITHSVQLTKYNANKTFVLPNAEFELRKMNSNLPEVYEVVSIDPKKLVTDENGTIYLDGLQIGDYQFVETKAPSGYYVNKEPVNFTITMHQTRTVYVEKTNNLIPDPVWPVEPGKPVDPDKPGENPGKPDEENSNKPGDKENPKNPDKEDPTDSEKPGKPGEENPSNVPNDEDPITEEKPITPGKPSDKDDSNNGPADNHNGNVNNGTTDGQPDSSTTGTGDVESDDGSKVDGQNVNASGKDTLPQTGEQHLLYMIILGFALMAIGGFMVVRRKSVE